METRFSGGMTPHQKSMNIHSKSPSDPELHELHFMSNNSSFKKKTECFIKQYDNYHFTPDNNPFNKINGKINGTRTQTENIADNGGIRAAYKAFS